MGKKESGFKVTTATLKRANAKLIRNGVGDKTLNSSNGDIRVRYKTRKGVVTKSISNSDIKKAYGKALTTVYAERI